DDLDGRLATRGLVPLLGLDLLGRRRAEVAVARAALPERDAEDRLHVPRRVRRGAGVDGRRVHARSDVDGRGELVLHVVVRAMRELGAAPQGRDGGAVVDRRRWLAGLAGVGLEAVEVDARRHADLFGEAEREPERLARLT